MLGLKCFLKGNELVLMTGHKHIGILTSKSGSYLRCEKHITEQTNNVMFSLPLRKKRFLNVPIEVHIYIFDKLIKTSIVYGCEMLAVVNIVIIEWVQLKFQNRY